MDKNLMIYFVRHAEAEHNVREKAAIREAIERGGDKKEQELARKKILQNSILRDAPLSQHGTLEAKTACYNLDHLLASGDVRYQPPTVVLVSPLRRALMTATLLFYHPENGDNNPQFLAMEALREKRTGLACDERHDVKTLRNDFPHINFDNVELGLPVVPTGEDNIAVKARAKNFMEDNLLHFSDSKFVALVSHKGWLREMRHTLKEYVTDGSLAVDFDVDEWDETLYKNSEVRVAEFRWEICGTIQKLQSIVSRSMKNAMSSIVSCSSEETPKYKSMSSIVTCSSEERPKHEVLKPPPSSS